VKTLFSIPLLVVLCSGCFTTALHDSIERQYKDHYRLKVINDLTGGYNSQRNIVIQNFREEYPQDFCLVKWSSYQEFQLSPTANTVVTDYVPIFNLYQDPKDEVEYIKIKEKTEKYLVLEIQEYGKELEIVKVYTEYQCEVNKLKMAGLKSLYPIAIAADLLVISIIVSSD